MTDIVYEHPLNEQARVYLRLDALLNQVTVARNQADMPYISLFRGLFDLQEILEQVQVKADLAKDLDKQRQRLRSLMDIPHVDQAMLQQILNELDGSHKAILSSPRLGQHLREDKFLSGIRQRFSLPGGSCSFDVPSLHHWLHCPAEQQQADISRWLSPLASLQTALALWLRIQRESSPFLAQTARNGFYQQDSDNGSMIRLGLSPEFGVYPLISGHRSRFAIRFIPFTEGKEIPENLPFRIAVC
ncbi:cell division protein ZapD [Parasalinivibrio latis]|uniref:cell division protein ZapD n=1 Tax=Parasalinivibrio latis TaxID=2952610 RepID=UPI0030E5E0B7